MSRKPRAQDPLEGLPKYVIQAMLKAIPAEKLPPPRVAEIKQNLIIFDNPDKVGSGQPSGEPPWMPSWPFRALLIGPPGSGKRNAALNLIWRLDPPPSHIHIVHIDADTKEYKTLEDLADVTMYTPEDPVSFKELEGDRPLVIVDEVPSKMLAGEPLRELTQLLTYGSTHRSCSVIMMFQNLTSIDVAQRRMFNFFCIWPNVDDAVLNLTAHRIGVPPEEMKELMSICRHPRDFLTVDASRQPNDPYRFRLNMMYPIQASKPSSRAKIN